ncbi:hypothetical protein [Nocardioides sp. AX2bis]|uniref:hypothetical protein n=1 Tax=Nocardioides sp. AX2bis TaxID=2653157 RepID=UPI0012F2A638|nr:hypothetical protein [Nocardioides sp. AX2bis]VXB77845.1 conserved hypothetical protein [Nocardioides sp. AX2bis]
MTPRRERDESGAVAVIAAVTLVLLVGCAALAFDLGNAWARARAVQLQADVSAMSAGHLLPMTSANRGSVAAEVATYLNRNQPSGSPTVSGADLVDGDTTDGEVTFTHADGTSCADQCVQMSVLAPPAVVDFAFAGVLGFDGTDVQRRATVRAFSELPPTEDVIPLWLPSGCGYGAVDGDTTQGLSLLPPTPTPTTPFTVSPIGSHTLSGPAKAVARGGQVSVTGWSIGSVPNNTRKASLRLVAPDGSFFVDYAVSESRPSGTLTVPTFQIGPEVSSTSGTWRAYGLLEANGNGRLEYSRTSVEVVVSAPVTPSPSASPSARPSAAPSPSPGATATTPAPSASTSPTSVPVGCAGQDRGNFGQLLSPRKDVGAKQSLALNMALGLDHVLVPFDFTARTPTKSCTAGGGLISGAVPDSVSRDGNNCIEGDTGNDGPRLFDGLVTGTGGHPGRLDVVNGPTTCAGRSDRVVGGRAVNNDLLSCFLRGGASLATISQDSGVTTDMLDARVLDSPRFVWLPLVVATDRAQKDFQPILDFVPAFITSETTTVNGASTPAENGVEVNGNSVKVIRLFAFNKDALPVAERSPTTSYRPELGRPLVRLVG